MIDKLFIINFYSLILFNIIFERNIIDIVINIPYNFHINIFIFIYITQNKRFLQGTKFNNNNLVSHFTYITAKFSFLIILINILLLFYDFSKDFYVIEIIQYYLCFYLDRAEFNGNYKVSDNNFIRYFLLNIKNKKNYDLIIEDNSVDLKKNALICLHPHGFIPINSAINILFLPKRLDIYKYNFPNFSESFYLAGASFNFFFPLLRELYLIIGCIDCSKPNIQKFLEKNKTVSLFPGGARESKYSGIGSTKIILNNRLGIFKVALETGTPLIPVFTFGENDIFTSVKQNDNFILELFHRLTGLWLCLIYYNFFNKEKIITVIGKPIIIEKKINYQIEDIERVQNLYKKNLNNIFEKYKLNFPNYNKKNLEFI